MRALKSAPWGGLMAVAVSVLAAGFALGNSVSFQTWHLTRAAGLMAFVLLWASVSIGLLQSSGFLKGLAAAYANIDLHEYISLAAVYATIFHTVILVWDRYMPFRWSDLLLPFASEYKPVSTGLGVIAFYIALIACVTTYLRGRMSAKTWRTLHLLSLVGFAASLVHGWVMGTDTHLPGVAFLYRFAAYSVTALVAVRVFRGVGRHAVAPGRR